MRKKNLQEVIIAGAGLAGLTAAINLARAGYGVKVFEKKSFIGQQEKETVQLLPNWFVKKDVIGELEECGLKINWLNKIREIEIYLGHKRKVVFFSQKIPLGYTVLRGGGDSLEKDLAEQARAEGVEIILGQEAGQAPDIIATGMAKILTVGLARVYKGNFNPEKARVFFGSQLISSIGYGYFFPHNEKIVTFKISKKIGEAVDIRKQLKEIQNEHLLEEIKENNFLYQFGTKRSFGIPKTAFSEKSFLVGEAAGFQDELFRFGMRYAIISGYLAAQSIIKNLDYDRLWKKRFLKEFRKTAKVKKLFCLFKKGKFVLFPKGLKIRIKIVTFKRIWLSPLFDLLLTIVP